MEKKTYEERVYELTRLYTVNDAQCLIDRKIDAAGLILMPVFAGMIALGHSLYGFDLDDRAAFLKFAQYRMKMQKALAKILFDNVRAGLIEMWCSESRVYLVAWDRKPDCERLCWQDTKSDTDIIVNATQVGRMYISAVQQLPDYSDTQQYQQSEDDKGLARLREQVTRFRSTLQGE